MVVQLLLHVQRFARRQGGGVCLRFLTMFLRKVLLAFGRTVLLVVLVGPLLIHLLGQ
jgi:hypothetical protein